MRTTRVGTRRTNLQCALALSGAITLSAPVALGAVAEIRLIVVASPSPSDVTGTLPPSQGYVPQGVPFFCEVWAQTTHASGLSSVSLDVLFDPAYIAALNITHTAIFAGLTNGAIDNPNGAVEDLSGSHVGPCADAVAVAPNWARLAVVEMQATGSAMTSLTATTTGTPAFGTAICGVGDLDPAQVEYGSMPLLLGEGLIPTVSQWGLGVMLILLLTCGTLVLRQRALK